VKDFQALTLTTANLNLTESARAYSLNQDTALFLSSVGAAWNW